LIAALIAGSVRTAAAQPPPSSPPTTVDASSGGITIASGVNSLTIGARAQVRWTVDKREEFDADRGGSGLGQADGPFSQFDVPRLRLTLSGGAFKAWLRYTFQFDFSRTSGESASKIKDAVIEFRPTGTPYRILAGQFKVPFGLQQLTSSGRLQFVDRAITDSKFVPARDMGVMFGGTAAGRKVGYEAGVFNGSGESVRQTRESPLWAGRVFFNPLGVYALAEGSSDAPDDPVLHLGIGVRGGALIRGRTQSGIVQDADRQTAVDVEFAYKAPRFYSTAEFFWMTDEQRNPFDLSDIKSNGYHAQAGFMLVPRQNEVALLYAWINADTSASDSAVTELRGVFGHYWRAHNLKLQADVGQIGYQAGFAELSSRARAGLPSLGTRLVSGQSLADRQFRLQLQLAF
jgi:phosphate-selective porin OprO/OprP